MINYYIRIRSGFNELKFGDKCNGQRKNFIQKSIRK